uniref:RING-type domain-containing protein n=1 Tax=Denticeps clupeoides TaxID=299321 RepID=A0AAY4AJ12_9TELE
MCSQIRSILVDQDRFCCPSCLEVLRDPMTTLCGHSYCMDCIRGHWNKNEQKDAYGCPQRRQTFSPRPVLGRNTMLAEIVEKLTDNWTPSVCPVQQSHQSHLKSHQERNHRKPHKVGEAMTQGQDGLCSFHNKPLVAYCRADHRSICVHGPEIQR